LNKIVENWILLAILCSFFESLKNLWSKKALQENIPALIVAFYTRFISGVLILPFTLRELIEAASNSNWRCLLIGCAALNAVNVFLFMRALAQGSLSSAEPTMNFTPFFLLLTAPLFIGELPTFLGVTGMLAIMAGAWVLNYKPGASIAQPFINLLAAPGPRLMLLVAFLASITTLLDKKGILLSSPLAWSGAVNLTISFLYFIILVYKKQTLTLLGWNKWFFWAGVANGLSTFCQMLALKLAFTAYVISLKRTSAIFSIVFGYYFLKENTTIYQLIGVIIMIGGVLLITFTR
jgi:uncharacterized membrane protein